MLVGSSGCGKSTVLRALAGLHRRGRRVLADGDAVSGPSGDRALVFQDDGLLPWRTVRRNVELPLAIRGVGPRAAPRQAEAWIERVGLAGSASTGCPASSPAGCASGCSSPARWSARPGLLHGRAVRRARRADPGGDAAAADRRARSTPATVVFVTHDVDEALLLADRIAVLRRAGRGGRSSTSNPATRAARAARDPRPPATNQSSPRSSADTTDPRKRAPWRSPPTERRELRCDVLVIGGGTAGTMAALTAAERGAPVLLLEKAHVRHSGALAMGMDGVNNAVIPGKATPEEYVAEITRANDGIVNQRTIFQTATRGFAMVQRLEGYGVKFEKDEYGEYAVRQVHRSGSYVLPMPEGKDVKKVLYRVLRSARDREKVRIENRVMPVRVLTDGGRAVGAVGFDTRTGEFVTVSAGAVILATGACGRLGLPASGYLYGTYENPTNAGDGYSMAYHAGAELTGIECFQINPLIKDYNGPACAYVANPFGGYQVNTEGERFVDCDYWSGQMMAEVPRETRLRPRPDLPQAVPPARRDRRRAGEHPAHHRAPHPRHLPRRARPRLPHPRRRDAHLRDRAVRRALGLGRVGRRARRDHRARPVRRRRPGVRAAQLHDRRVRLRRPGGHPRRRPTWPAPEALPEDQIAAAHELIYRPLRNPDGPPQPQVEYKLRRFVNDYLAPPKTARKLEIALEAFERMRAEIDEMGARTPHELMRCAEVHFIRDCAEMAARSSLVRTESRWGLYHERVDHPRARRRELVRPPQPAPRRRRRMEFLTRPVAVPRARGRVSAHGHRAGRRLGGGRDHAAERGTAGGARAGRRAERGSVGPLPIPAHPGAAARRAEPAPAPPRSPPTSPTRTRRSGGPRPPR